jgi:dTMP kinase
VSAPGNGRLIALEGIDGCGKSTQARLLADALGALLTHEPGGTRLGTAVRRLLLDVELPLAGPVARAEALLVAADRAQHVTEVVRPALLEGRWVVTDRFSGSTLAYQGYGRGLEIAPLRQVVEWAADGVTPDLSVLVDVPVDVAAARLSAVAPDRLERLDDGFFGRVREGYLTMAGDDASHWAIIDGSPPADDVAAVVLEVVRHRLGSPPDRTTQPGHAGTT